MLSEISGENIGSLCFLFNFFQNAPFCIQSLLRSISDNVHLQRSNTFFKQFVVSLLFLPIYTSDKSTNRSEEEWSICCVYLLKSPR